MRVRMTKRGILLPCIQRNTQKIFKFFKFNLKIMLKKLAVLSLVSPYCHFLHFFIVQFKCEFPDLDPYSKNQNKTTIEMMDLPKSMYFLKVSDGTNIVKTFKIIKN